VVIPVYNNALNISGLAREILTALAAYNSEIILIDDRSTDDSWATVCALTKLSVPGKQIRGFRLSKNFGQHVAILSGLRETHGDFIAIIDADGQDNPADIPRLIAQAEKGYDVVHTQRQIPRFSMRGTFSVLVHKLLTTASEMKKHRGLGGFKLLTKRAVAAALEFRATQPLIEIMVSRIGFEAAYVDVVRRPRSAGSSSYGFRGWFYFIVNTMVTYSSLPFAIFLLTGMLLVLVSAITLTAAYATLSGKGAVILAAGFVSGLLLIAAATLGYYIRQIQMSERHWPLYLIDEQTDFTHSKTKSHK
jgi:polyisoprenyl-phosphate glycosyltransferase